MGFYSRMFFKSCWLLCRFLRCCSGIVCEQQDVDGGSCFFGSCDDVWGFWYNFCLCCFVDCGVSFVLGVSIIDFEDSPLLGGISYRFFWIFSSMHGCWDFSLEASHLSFVCCYFQIPSLTLIVLVKIHCGFNKFHFDFFKKLMQKIHGFSVRPFSLCMLDKRQKI